MRLRWFLGAMALVAVSSAASAQDCCCFFQDSDSDGKLECANVTNQDGCTALGGTHDKFEPTYRCIQTQIGQNEACIKKVKPKDIIECIDDGQGGCNVMVIALCSVPTMSTWGLLVVVISIVSGGILLMRRRMPNPTVA